MGDKPKVVVYAHIWCGLGQDSGGDVTLQALLKAMVADGWDAEVLVYNAPMRFETYVIDGVRVSQELTRRDAINMIQSANLVLTHLDGSERSCYIARKFKTPVAHYVHNDMGPTHGYLGLKCDLAVFNTAYISGGFPEVDCRRMVLHPLVDPADYAATLDKDGRVTMVNMWPNKGADVFYQCAEALPDVQFATVYGGYGVQDIRGGFENVLHLPQTGNMAEVYGQSRLILMPSKYESFGRVAVEAMASGIPSIVSPTPGLIESLDGAGTFASTPGEFIAAIKKLSKPQAYNKASRACVARSAALWGQTQEELAEFLVAAREVMERGRLARGW